MKLEDELINIKYISDGAYITLTKADGMLVIFTFDGADMHNIIGGKEITGEE